MNQDTEIRNGYTVTATMKRIWSIQLEMVSHILDVCKRHDLRIWADWGTLLGTVREHGFIPWDDDIDLMMMRDDYEKLVSLADSEFKSPFFLQCVHTEKNYFHGHIQVRYDGTSAVLPIDINQNFHQGVFVDIFVYDNIPDKFDEHWKWSIKKAKWLKKCLLTTYYGSDSTFKFLVAWSICKIVGSMKIYRMYERQFTKYNLSETKRIACPTFDYKQVERESKDREWYSETLWLPFENIKLPVPKEYDKVLRSLYGNSYMTPAQASSGHGVIIFDTERSYTELLAEMRKNKQK